ncbi:putative polysaccharide biosynthesis protein [Vallitalea maricola]|uniref:Polysaccharide biosynthesis protein n=1 Tax=Vallitalea maricola TaxID=3074433 RepID=A0ACB5UKN8_9FIRM|nr:polysaccharide biosynthesis protein [Vallitalea sp. AN17-2]
MNSLKQKRKGRNLAVQGAILASAGIIVRLIGFAYRIPLVNTIGEEGIGCYSKAFDIYSFGLIISSYGLPSAVSKLVSARMAVKKYKEAHKIFISALFIALLIGLISASIMFFGSSLLADLVYSEKSQYAIKALSPTLLIFSIMAVLRGYFQGMNTMIPTAISQVIEQIFNAIFSIVLASILFTRGYEWGAAGGTLGTGIGAFAGLLTLIGIYFMSRKLFLKRVRKDSNSDSSITHFSFGKLVVMTSVPIIIGSATFHFTNLVDMFMFNDALRFHNYTQEMSDTLYGILNGKYKIIITLPVSIASALAAATIPSITTSIVLKDKKQIKRKINMAIRFTMFIAIPSCVGIFILSEPIIRMLFGISNLEKASLLLKIGSISVVFFALSTISIGVLQGMDRLRVPVISAVKSLLIKVVFNVILLYAFDTNLIGAVVTNIIFAFSSAFFNMRAIKKYTRMKFDIKKTYIIPTISALVMGLSCNIVYTLFGAMRIGNTISTLISILVGACVYLILLIKLKGLDKEELYSLPKGESLIRLLTKMRLLK